MDIKFNMNISVKLMYKTSKAILLFAIFLFFLRGVNAQETILKGVIAVGNTQYMSYQINYQAHKNNTITGFSISDVDGSEETKASITGFIDLKKKTMYFQEKSIISSRSKTPLNEFCFMKVHGKFERKAGKSVFSGKFHSESPGKGISCDSGSVMLMTEKELKELTTKVEKAIEKIPKPDTLKKAEDQYTDPSKWVRRELILEPETETVLELKSDFILLELVDDKYQDGDKITIKENDKIILTDFEITNRVKSLKFSVTGNDKTLIITLIATDEGTIPLTTVKAVLRNGNESNLINASMNKGQSIKITLQKQ